MINDQDPDNGGAPAPSSEEIVEFLNIMLAKSADPEDLLQKIAEFCSNASSGAGAVGDDAPNNNLSATTTNATDRRRAGARDRKPAQDAAVRALNSKSFAARHPFLNGLDVWR